MESKNKIRQPKQERSIETKNRIIMASYQLFEEVGYYGTNTAEIAKRAGVSTGIVYGYFKDKKDILSCALEIYLKEAFEPIFLLLDKIAPPIDFNVIIPKFLDQVIKIHSKHAKMHEALHSYTQEDLGVQQHFLAQEDRLTIEIENKLLALNVKIDNPKERIHFCMDIIQSFSHEFVFDKHDYIDYDKMKEMVVKTLISLFNN